jgi:GTP pyrophosphokinase
MMPDLGERFIEALEMAVRLHQRQNRKGTSVPYVAHLLGVCSLVLEHGGGEDEAIAALLHDAVEDQGGQATYDAIKRAFGEGVARLVAACTDAWSTPKPPWKQRKLEILDRLPQESDGALLVAAADKLYNLHSVLAAYREVGELVWGRFSGGRDEQLWYYRTVVAVLRETGRVPPPLLAEMERDLAALESLLAHSAVG